MAPFVVNPENVHEFRDMKTLEAWYRKHHAKADEMWIKVHKKESGLASVSITDALDVALCWTSIWSKKNIGNVERLIAAGRMMPDGQAEIDKAKADGRWDRAYGSGAQLETPADLLAAIKAEPKAQALYDKLNAQNRFALAFRVHNLKTAAGRQKRIADFVAMLKRGETIYPNGKGKGAGKTTGDGS